MISFAIKHLVRPVVTRPVPTTCLPALSFSSRENLHFISHNGTRPLDTRLLNFLPSRNISFNLFDKAIRKQRINYSGTLLYEGIADKLNYQYFFDEFQMDDTFYSWFLITELHVWMLMIRTMQEGDDGMKLRNFMLETMWEDVNVRSKKLDIPNAALAKKQLKIISEEFNASIIGYDEAVQANDAILAGHLWRRFFSKDENIDPFRLEKLVHYIRKQLFNLSHVGKADLFSMAPRINWVYI